MFAASRSHRLLGEGGSVLPYSIIFGDVTDIVREGEELLFTMEWGSALPRFAIV